MRLLLRPSTRAYRGLLDFAFGSPCLVGRISWIKTALKDFERFPAGAHEQIVNALRVAARGEKADIAKPMKGFGSGIYEIALAYRGEAYRTMYAVQIGQDIWVVHVFRLKEMLR